MCENLYTSLCAWVFFVVLLLSAVFLSAALRIPRVADNDAQFTYGCCPSPSARTRLADIVSRILGTIFATLSVKMSRKVVWLL